MIRKLLAKFMKGCDKISYIILLVIFPFLLIYPQTEQYKFRHLTNEDGLPSTKIEYIMRDSHGFMWFGTISGLCRYDGYNIKVYRYDPDDSTSLTHSAIRSNILEDSDGFLWMGNLFGLNRFDPVTESFKRYVHDPSDSTSISSNLVFALCQDDSGTIWVGTTGRGGLNRYNRDRDNFTVYKQTIDVRNNNIISLYEDRSGILWIGTGNGLFQFDRLTERFVPIIPEPPLPKNFTPRYFSIREDIGGNLWFATDKAILTFKKSKSKTHVLAPLFGGEIQFGGDFFAQDILVEQYEGDEVLWIASNELIKFNIFSRNVVSFVHEPDNPESIIGTTFKNIFKDEAGTIWISSDHGVNILDKESDQIEKHSDSFKKYGCDASVFFEDSKGFFWIGTNSKGIIQFDNQMNQIKWFEELYHDNNDFDLTGVIWSIFEDSYRNLWVGDNNTGLYLFDTLINKFVHCNLEGLEVGKQTIWINYIYEDSEGVLWIGTQSGLFKKEKESSSLTDFRFIGLTDPPMRRPVTSIYEDGSGYLWVGGNATGLFCQTPELRGTDTFIKYTHDPDNNHSLSSNNVWKIHEDAKGTVWIATYEGLNIFDREKNSFKRIQFQTNPGSNFIYDLVEDWNGNFWMTTDNGLIRFKNDQETNENNTPYEIKQFLPFSDIFTYKISRNKDGKIFVGAKFGSAKGFFSFYPDSLKNNKRIPPLEIIDFKIDNKSAKMDSSIILKKQIILNYNENFFSFEFAALDYTDPGKNRYAYYLEGLEDDWIYCGDRRLASYSGIQPGKYTFRVKGSNNDGYWNEEGAFVRITILPPPWKSWWAYSLYGIILMGVFILWRWYDLKRQKLRQELELEHLEAEKLKELDKMKSRFFANISHEFRTPLTLILGPIEKLRSYIKDKEPKEDLNMMQRNANRLQNLINQLLSLSKLESGKMKLQAREVNIVSLVNGYVQHFESLAKHKNIDLSFNSIDEEIKLFVDKDKIEKILYNLLSNAFKFTGERGRIEVVVTPLSPPSRGETHHTLVSSQPNVEIKISDTGRGIPPEKLDHIFDRFYQADDSYTKDQEGTGIGLALTKELVEIHHGKITVESNPDSYRKGEGTTFYVFLPQGKEHLNPNEILKETEITAEIEESYKPVLELELLENSSKPADHLDQDEFEEKNDKPFLLIVDDNADLRTYIRGYLNPLYNISEARDGEEGFNKATEKIPDLIISDVMMPKMDGMELCRRLKTDERTSHIPVILLTAKAASEDKLKGLKTGADDFISKPFDPDELLIRIKNLINQRKMLQERFMRNIANMGIKQLMTLDTPDLTSMDQNFLQKAIDYIMENISDPDINVVLLGEKMALSQRQLQRKIMGITGNSPNKFIRSVRLNRAAKLISNKTGNVTEIAYEVGFNNLSWFAKSFKEQFGVLPSEYPPENLK